MDINAIEGHRFPAYRDLKEVYDAWKEVTDCLLIRSNQSFLQPAEADDESETESDDEAPTAENEDVDVQIVNHGLAGEGDEDQDYEVRNEKVSTFHVAHAHALSNDDTSGYG
jgi:hypothetical protein